MVHHATRDEEEGGGLISGQDAEAQGLEAGRILFAGACDFVRGVTAMDALPEADRTEIAFAGRSNVGKSSLINALTGRQTLARTSNTPGRTQELNFFTLGGLLFLVDLPGYGYAAAPKAQVERWTRLMKTYLRGRPSLKRVFLLIDARHGVKPVDAELMALLDEAAVSYQIVLTKADKITRADLQAVEEKTREFLRKRPAAHPDLLASSAVKCTGIPEIRAAIAALAAGG